MLFAGTETRKQTSQSLPPDRSCVRLWAEEDIREDTEEAAGFAQPVWAEVGENVLRGYLQRENSMGSGTTAAVFGGKSGDFGLPKKVLDKGPPW